MLEKFKKNALTIDQLKLVKGGYVVSCVCGNGTSYGCAGDRSDLIACAQTFCGSSGAVCQHEQV